MPTNDEKKTCKRPGCTRTLRSNNTKGVCADLKVCEGTAPAEEIGSAFSAADLAEDDELAAAPPAARPAKKIRTPKAKTAKKIAGPDLVAELPNGGEIRFGVELMPEKPAAKTLRQFRQLASAIGFDPDETLAGFAQTFIDRAKRAVTAPRLVGMYGVSPGGTIPKTAEEAKAAWDGVLRANVKQDSSVAIASEHPGKCGIVGCDRPGYSIARDIDPAGNAVELCQAHHDEHEASKLPPGFNGATAPAEVSP